jgi:hypothetical protein
MPRRSFALIAALGILAAGGVAAQEEDGPLDRVGQIDASEYIRSLLQNDQYDPRDRERALNGARQIDPHWRSSIFDGRRTRATRGTGLRVPDLPQEPSE